MIFAGVVDEHGRGVGLGRAVFQILIEEGPQHVAAKFQRCVAGPLDRVFGSVSCLDHHSLGVVIHVLHKARNPMGNIILSRSDLPTCDRHESE